MQVWRMCTCMCMCVHAVHVGATAAGAPIKTIDV